MLAVFIVFGAVAGAKAKELHADSTGGDWLMAAGEERSEWVERMARIFNKEAPFASAVEGCLELNRWPEKTSRTQPSTRCA